MEGIFWESEFYGPGGSRCSRETTMVSHLDHCKSLQTGFLHLHLPPFTPHAAQVILF